MINLAKKLADISNEKVLLLDFNNSSNNISFLLNIAVLHNINYYVKNLTDINANLLLPNVTKYKNSSLYIMTNSFIKNKSIPCKTENIYNTINILKHYYKYILIDYSSNDLENNEETIINLSDEIFYLLLPFISSFGKIKSILDNYYKHKNIKIILNQYSIGDETKVNQIQTLLGYEIFWQIPKNYTALNTAINNNTTISEAALGSDIDNSYLELAKCIINRE